MKIKPTLIILLLITLFTAKDGFAQTPGSHYTVQAGDWLSKIAEQAYGDAHLYYRIIQETNKKATTDNSLEPILKPNQLVEGQELWIPTLLTSSSLVDIPNSDCEIRLWYNFQVVAIGVINEKWEEDGIDLATRALKAYEMRHEARVNARFMMQDKAAVKTLQERDMQKYGNPDGPSFDYLVKKNTNKGMSEAEAYQAIIDSSSKTDPNYNADCQ